MIGRDSLVGSLVRQLPGRRFMTLTGPAGVGKSTTALRVAELLLQHYREGVWLVDLTTLDDPARLVEQLASSLELDPQLHGLVERHTLLVLDNCAHLRDGCRALVERLLATAPRLSILVTSREPLGARDECVQRLPPLAVPPASALHSVEEAMGYSAVQLFVSRARACQQDFVLREQDLVAVREICRRLDGLPLAIELAATQIGALALVGLQAQLDNCFQLLTQGRSRWVSVRRRLSRSPVVHSCQRRNCRSCWGGWSTSRYWWWSRATACRVIVCSIPPVPMPWNSWSAVGRRACCTGAMPTTCVRRSGYQADRRGSSWSSNRAASSRSGISQPSRNRAWTGASNSCAEP